MEKKLPVITPEHLWKIIDWHPLFRTVYGLINPPPVSQQWVEWAIAEIQSGDKIVRYANTTICDHEKLALYLCRLMCVMDSARVVIGSGSRDQEYEYDSLRINLIGGLTASGVNHDTSHIADIALRLCQDQGLIKIIKVDHWHPGMKSGSGMQKHIKLTFSGKVLAETVGTVPQLYQEMPPPPEAKPFSNWRHKYVQKPVADVVETSPMPMKDEREQAFEGLPFSRKLAYSQYSNGCRTLGECTDQQAYDYLKKHVLDLEHEQLPPFDTWTKYLRECRKVLGTQKNLPRTPPPYPTGKSVIWAKDVEPSYYSHHDEGENDRTD